MAAEPDIKETLATETYLTTSWITYTPNMDILQSDEIRTYDNLLATAFCVCLLIGLPGNIMSLVYFISSKKRDLSTLLFMVACSVDIGSSVFHLPVVFCLYNQRNPGLFTNKIVCGIWYFLVLFLQQISMFLVMLIAVIRAIVIAAPFYQLHKRTIFLSLAFYVTYIVLSNMIIFVPAWSYSYYSRGLAYCLHQLRTDFTSHWVLWQAYQINYNISIIIPPAAVSFAFIFSVFKLLKCRGNAGSVSRKNNLNASITIACFSATFLFCNSFAFVNNMIYAATLVIGGYEQIYHSSKFMLLYSWVITEVFCTVLNAALNPVIYLFRMKDMRMWAMRGLTQYFHPKIRPQISLDTNRHTNSETA